MAIEWTQQALTLSDVKNIVVTPVARDDESGEFIRELRIFGGDDAVTAPIQGIDEFASDQKGHLLVTLRLKTKNRQTIHITAPSLEF
jgi:hypothetical protein